MKNLKIGNKEILLVEVPSIAFGFDVNNYGDSAELMFMLDIEEITDEPSSDETLITKPLPSTGWRILGSGKADAITEEEWKEVVEVDNWRDDLGYKDYGNQWSMTHTLTPKESGHSLLSLHNFNLSSMVVLIKQ